MLKRCTCCGREFEASTDNFYKNKDGKDGLRSQCKKCERTKKNNKKGRC